ncbi:MAG: 6,7-dimethyl-8-ribityllumazine synthase [Candidatus Omnitrophica bacterium]|nr:6,7-dimethyl-8-ribityllumazine synthase [Candidatus Omnitrophota bacterium]
MKRYGIVASRFNREITQRLVEGARRFFQRKKVRSTASDVVWVPGAFELPTAALRMARSGRYRGVVAVGCILEGETAHYRYLSGAVLHGLMTAGLLAGIPVGCGVITARSWKAAAARSQERGLNRGQEAAEAVWEMTHGRR